MCLLATCVGNMHKQCEKLRKIFTDAIYKFLYFRFMVILGVYRFFIPNKIAFTNYSVDVIAPQDLWHPLSEAVPGRFYGLAGIVITTTGPSALRWDRACLSDCPPLCLFVCMCIPVNVSACVSLPMTMSLYVFFLIVSISKLVYALLSRCLCVCLFMYLTVSLSVCLSVYEPFY